MSNYMIINNDNNRFIESIAPNILNKWGSFAPPCKIFPLDKYKIFIVTKNFIAFMSLTKIKIYSRFSGCISNKHMYNYEYGITSVNTSKNNDTEYLYSRIYKPQRIRNARIKQILNKLLKHKQTFRYIDYHNIDFNQLISKLINLIFMPTSIV